MRDCVQAHWWGRCACRGMRAVPCLCIQLYPGIRLTTEENHRKPSVGVAEKCRTADRWARIVWSTWCRFTGDLDRSAGRYHLWFAHMVTWAHPRLDICLVNGLRVETVSQGSDVVGDKRNSQILVNVPLNHVPRGRSSNAETLGI
jgi:hypothetical protein